MGRVRIYFSENRLRHFYCKRGLSTIKIARIFGCSWSTIANRLKEYGIPLRARSEMRVTYQKRPFTGTEVEKAYLLGFRLGDLNVYRPHLNSKIFVARCHTTHRTQVSLIKSLFDRYGRVTITNSPSNGFTVNCFLDNSFDFLHEKKFPSWIFRSKKHSVPFVAGYTDAEGSFGLNQKKGRFKIDSYDFLILKSTKNFLEASGVKVKFRCIAKKGTRRYGGLLWNNNLWRLNVNEANSLQRFINMLMPHLRHKKRMRDAKIVFENIVERRKNGTI